MDQVDRRETRRRMDGVKIDRWILRVGMLDARGHKRSETQVGITEAYLASIPGLIML